MIGTTLSHYRILEKLGQGGMGVVYRAEDTNLGRQVAIKVLPEAFSGDPERMARFEREAKLLASLSHQNIASIFGLEEADGERFIVMELAEGETLARRISHGSLPVDEALEVCRQIAEGLEAAHEKGIIHRDLKPSNVMVSVEGKVKILDFGLARAMSGEATVADPSHSPTITETMTRPGVVLGTAAYMSPEQARGKPVDKRADIWAFGCILYECLTGKAPFKGETVTETLASILKVEPDWMLLPAEIPAIVPSLLGRCLQKDPVRRLHDVADARLEIEEARTAPLVPAIVPSGKKTGRPSAFLLSVGALVLGAAIAGFAVWYLKPSPLQTVAQVPVHLSVNLPLGDQLATATYPPIALSPDGSLLVYVANRDGAQQLFVRRLDSQEAKSLPGTEGAEYPFFSPDGRWIGFFTRGKLKKVTIAGGTVLTLCDSGSLAGATWGTNDTIVFSPSAASGLLQVSAAGGKPQVLTSVDRAKGEASHRYPQLLPGGKALLFTVHMGGGWDESHVAVLPMDTGESRIVLRGGNTGRYVPTGHLVYYRAGTLLAVPFDPVRLEVTDSTPVTIAEGIARSGTSGGEYSFSSAGLLAYVPASPSQFERRLVWMDRKGAIELLPVTPRAYGGSSLSPDGQQVALAVTSGTNEIWIYDITRGTLTRLEVESASNPIWTPDGKRVTYRGMRVGLRNIFWKSADGTGDEEQLTKGENAQTPTSWSPDGKWLAFSDQSPSTGYDIWMLRLDGERKQELFLGTPFNELSAKFSPDGLWLAYQSNESGRDEIYVQAFPGSGAKWKISTEGGSVPCWARNGRELFYYYGDKIMSVDIKTEPTFAAGKPRLLFEGQSTAFGDVSPDSQRFLLMQPVEPEQPATQINLVLNWFEELKRLVPTGK